MDNVNECISFSYEFVDKDDGRAHKTECAKRGVFVKVEEVCEMFVEFMKSAGYSEENVFNYFRE